MLNICESGNFMWSTNDLLGKGATAAVYKGISKCNSDSVAVKCYNASITQPEEQLREFDVLQKINHENIVKLLAIEENLTNRRKVIVMELCTGGSLLDNLLEPKNAYGLEETEFMLVLKHLYSGMKYLRENNIIHRDIKPGNMMKCIHEDGTSIYKLADFGAARELKDDETFDSIYGTKLYLHPNVYEVAVLRRSTNQQFNSSVDLWSIGVTLYHVATGTLPFKVCEDFKNKETLHYITTKKESGIISGIQNRKKDPIIWSRDLPETCLLSDSLKKNITQLIAGLLESNNDKIWTFEQFFSTVDNLLSHRVLHVFYMNKVKLIKVYIPPQYLFKDLQEHIKEQTNIEEGDQILMYKKNMLKSYIQDCTKVLEFPETSEDNPILLLNKSDDYFSIVPIQIPLWEGFPVNISVENDMQPTMNASITGHYFQREINKYSMYCKLIYHSVENFFAYIDMNIREMQLKTHHLLETMCILKNSVKIFNLSQKIYQNNSNNYEIKLQNIYTKFTTGTALEVTNLYNTQCIENNMKSSWNGSIKDIKCPIKCRISAKAKKQIGELQKSWNYFMKQPITPALTYSQGQWHVMERRKIRQILNNLSILLQKETFSQYFQLAKCFESWCKSAQKIYSEINILQSEIQQYEEKLRDFEKEYTLSFTQHKDPRQPTNSKYFQRCVGNYYKNNDNLYEILSENTRLMNQIQNFARCLKE